MAKVTAKTLEVGMQILIKVSPNTGRAYTTMANIKGAQVATITKIVVTEARSYRIETAEFGQCDGLVGHNKVNLAG